MAQILFIDPLDKLNIKKDSTLMVALSFKKLGAEVYILFEEDFYLNNGKETKLSVYDFKGELAQDGYYLKDFELTEKKEIPLSKDDTIHMRIDPPYDTRYQRYLWMLDFLQEISGCEISNDPKGIMLNNEKIEAFKLKHSVESFVGSSVYGFTQYLSSLKELGHDEVVLKPMDLYSGIGVIKEKIGEEAIVAFKQHVKEYHGAIVAQPFLKEVYNGEFRAVYFDGKEVGSIIKKPNPGEFLTNIAQGAKYEKVELPENVRKECDKVAQELLKEGVRIIAFDILGEAITEINVTCPGLFVEVSYANNKNISEEYAKLFIS
jgi:glutathione synthase